VAGVTSSDGFLVIIIIILYYAIYGSTQAHKYEKAKIHLKYDLKYKKDINTNIKAHGSSVAKFRLCRGDHQNTIE